MRFTYFFVIMLCLAACTPSTTAITEEEVVETLNGFFDALDVENDDPNLIDTYVTEDFLIYEAGKIMNKAEFTEEEKLKIKFYFSDNIGSSTN